MVGARHQLIERIEDNWRNLQQIRKTTDFDELDNHESSGRSTIDKYSLQASKWALSRVCREHRSNLDDSCSHKVRSYTAGGTLGSYDESKKSQNA